jgi:hypothetical protein
LESGLVVGLDNAKNLSEKMSLLWMAERSKIQMFFVTIYTVPSHGEHMERREIKALNVFILATYPPLSA